MSTAELFHLNQISTPDPTSSPKVLIEDVATTK